MPWQAISGIETVSHEHIADVAAYNFRTHDARGRGSRTVAAVRIVRASGHPVQLPVPLVTDSQDDLGFDDKVRLIRARWQQAAPGMAGHPCALMVGYMSPTRLVTVAQLRAVPASAAEVGPPDLASARRSSLGGYPSGVCR